MDLKILNSYVQKSHFPRSTSNYYSFIDGARIALTDEKILEAAGYVKKEKLFKFAIWMAERKPGIMLSIFHKQIQDTQKILANLYNYEFKKLKK